MNFTRTDANSLLAIALGTAVGIATLGPQMWATTTVTTTYTSYATVDAQGDQHEGPAERSFGESVVPGSVVPSTDESVVPSTPQPLIYLDGVRIAGELPSLDPTLIERVEVVKGDAALELFGEEGAFGVVQIFSKDPAPNPGG